MIRFDRRSVAALSGALAGPLAGALAGVLLVALCTPALSQSQGQRRGGSAGGNGDSRAARIMSNRDTEALAKAGAALGRPDAPIVVPPAEWTTIDPDNLLVIDTNRGRIVAELTPTLAPATVARIQTLARQHFYDGLTFFRVIPSFMDQTGDPKNTGEGGSTLPDLKGEFTFRRRPELAFAEVAQPEGSAVGFVGANPVYSQATELMAMTKDGGVSAWGAYCPGVLGMARETAPDSANSQFFLMRDAYPSLEQKYAAFGRVLVGLDVVRSIKSGEPVADPQDKMTRVRLASDLPAGEKPVVVQRQDPTGATFRTMVVRAREKQGADFSVCDVTPQVKQS